MNPASPPVSYKLIHEIYLSVLVLHNGSHRWPKLVRCRSVVMYVLVDFLSSVFSSLRWNDGGRRCRGRISSRRWDQTCNPSLKKRSVKQLNSKAVKATSDTANSLKQGSPPLTYGVTTQGPQKSTILTCSLCRFVDSSCWSCLTYFHFLAAFESVLFRPFLKNK